MATPTAAGRAARAIAAIGSLTGARSGTTFARALTTNEASTSAAAYAKDRKSTRLNSSHEWISYAVFCLKKKKRRRERPTQGSGEWTERRGSAARAARP